MKRFICLLGCLLAAGESAAQPQSHGRTMESIVPWMAYNSSCWSAVELQNLGNRDVTVEVEAHKSSGALAPFARNASNQIHLGAGEHTEYRLQLPEETIGAWVRVRESIPLPNLAPVLAVGGTTECLSEGALSTTVREVVWPTRNPWFSGDIKQGDDRMIAVINTSEQPAQITGCYSSGVLYSVPTNDRPTGDLTAICAETIQELLPPFASRQFPVSRGGNPHFSLTTRGEKIVLQMLQPVNTNVRLYRVESTIKFEKEVP